MNTYSHVCVLFPADVIAFTVPKILNMYESEIESFKKKLTDKYNDFHARHVLKFNVTILLIQGRGVSGLEPTFSSINWAN